MILGCILKEIEKKSLPANLSISCTVLYLSPRTYLLYSKLKNLKHSSPFLTENVLYFIHFALFTFFSFNILSSYSWKIPWKSSNPAYYPMQEFLHYSDKWQFSLFLNASSDGAPKLFHSYSSHNPESSPYFYCGSFSLLKL